MQQENDYSDQSKYKLEPYSTDRAQGGEPVCTRLGKPVHIIEYGVKSLKGKVQNPTEELHFEWHTNGSWSQEKETPLDLFHPVAITVQSKTKRIPFDLEKYQAGIGKPVFRDSAFIFISILDTDLMGQCPILVKYSYTDEPTSYEAIRLTSKGKLNAFSSDHAKDLLLEVPDDSPIIPSELDVAKKVGATMLKVINEEGVYPWLPYQDMGRMEALARLMLVARYVNDGWERDPDNIDQVCYFLELFMGPVAIPLTDGPYGQVLFKSEEAAMQAGRILNDWSHKQGLGEDGILRIAFGLKTQ